MVAIKKYINALSLISSKDKLDFVAGSDTVVKILINETAIPAMPCPDMTACMYTFGKRPAKPKIPNCNNAVQTPQVATKPHVKIKRKFAVTRLVSTNDVVAINTKQFITIGKATLKRILNLLP